MPSNEKIIFLNKDECQKLIEEIHLIRSSIKEVIDKIQKEQVKRITAKKVIYSS